MKNSNLETLVSFGLDDKEAKLYLALLELGKATVLQLSRRSGVERSGIYYLLKGLRRRGLIRESYDSNNTLYLSPAPPEHLMQLEKNRLETLQSSLPELKALYSDNPSQPRVQIFEGPAGWERLYEDVIETLKHLPKEKREVLQYGTIDEVLHVVPDAGVAFRKKRLKYQIYMRHITSESLTSRDMQLHDNEELREIKIIKEKTEPFGSAMTIYANKVAQYSISGELFILMIEHKDYANLQKTIFDLAWKQTEGKIIN